MCNPMFYKEIIVYFSCLNVRNPLQSSWLTRLFKFNAQTYPQKMRATKIYRVLNELRDFSRTGTNFEG